MPLGRLINKTATNKTGIKKSVDSLVKSPMIIKKPPRRCSHVIMMGNHSLAIPILVSVNMDSRITESFMKEMPFIMRQTPKATLKKTSHRG